MVSVPLTVSKASSQFKPPRPPRSHAGRLCSTACWKRLLTTPLPVKTLGADSVSCATRRANEGAACASAVARHAEGPRVQPWAGPGVQALGGSAPFGPTHAVPPEEDPVG